MPGFKVNLVGLELNLVEVSCVVGLFWVFVNKIFEEKCFEENVWIICLVFFGRGQVRSLPSSFKDSRSNTVSPRFVVTKVVILSYLVEQKSNLMFHVLLKMVESFSVFWRQKWLHWLNCYITYFNLRKDIRFKLLNELRQSFLVLWK